MKSTEKPTSIAIGCWVKIKDPDIGEETIHVINKEDERPGKGRLSTESPFVQALLGAKPGQKVIYTMPHGGNEEVEVLDFGWD